MREKDDGYDESTERDARHYCSETLKIVLGRVDLFSTYGTDAERFFQQQCDIFDLDVLNSMQIRYSMTQSDRMVNLRADDSSSSPPA